jgi:hypothetical protein
MNDDYKLDKSEIPTQRTNDNAPSDTPIYDHNLAAMARRYPEATALLLEQMGINEIDIYEANRKLGL